MGTDQLGNAFSKHAPTTPRIGTTKSPDQQLDVDRPAVSGQIHQQPCIAAVPATGDATAQRARRSRSGALGGDGNVCRGKFLLPDDQTDASKREDVDLDRGVLFIVGETKTEESVRAVGLDDDTVAVLRRHKKEQEWLKRMEGPRYENQGLVFTTERGTSPSPSNLRNRYLYPLCEKAGVPR